jgi:hypothetical protein
MAGADMPATLDGALVPADPLELSATTPLPAALAAPARLACFEQPTPIIQPAQASTRTPIDQDPLIPNAFMAARSCLKTAAREISPGALFGVLSAGDRSCQCDHAPRAEQADISIDFSST